MRIRTYSELRRIIAFEDRFEYLKLGGVVGDSTFGFDRYVSQMLYRSRRWKKIRNEIIIRDDGMDIGVFGYPIGDRIIVHHMNPLSFEDIENESEDIFNSEFLISVSSATHNAIHFGDKSLLTKKPIERSAGDTCLW